MRDAARSRSSLELRDLSLEAAGKTLLRSFSLSMHSGEMIALLGPNGGGKTSTIRAALGLHKPAAGSVLLEQRPLFDFTQRERAAHIAWLPQMGFDREPIPAIDLVASARFRFGESLAAARKHALAAMKAVAASQLAAQHIDTLSGGESQRVALACLLAQEASLLLLDEPANHLDPAQQQFVYRFLGHRWEAGDGILCVTHDINLLRHLGPPEQTSRIRVVGMDAGTGRFELRYDAPELKDALEALYGLRLTVVEIDGQRCFLSASEQAKAPIRSAP